VRKPPAVDANIRIIEIKEFDYSPCGGTHCSRTGEIGIVKIRRFENYKGGTRVHFLCGLRALKDYQEKSTILKQIGESLSAGETDLYKNIIKIRDELKYFFEEFSNVMRKDIHFWKLYFSLFMQPRVLKLVEKRLSGIIHDYMRMLSSFFAASGYEDPEIEAIMLGAILDGVGFHFMLDPDRFPIERVKDKLIKMYCVNDKIK